MYPTVVEGVSLYVFFLCRLISEDWCDAGKGASFVFLKSDLEYVRNELKRVKSDELASGKFTTERAQWIRDVGIVRSSGVNCLNASF